MSRSRRLALALAVLCATTAVAVAHGYKRKHIEIIHPWIAETAGPDGTVSMTIRNGGKEPDRLVGVRCPEAESARLVSSGPSETPVPVLIVPAGGEATLSHNGPLLAVAGLKRRLSAYDHLPLVLEFEKAGRITIEAMVEERPE